MKKATSFIKPKAPKPKSPLDMQARQSVGRRGGQAAFIPLKAGQPQTLPPLQQITPEQADVWKAERGFGGPPTPAPPNFLQQLTAPLFARRTLKPPTGIAPTNLGAA